jgi:hypothetical protein
VKKRRQQPRRELGAALPFPDLEGLTSTQRSNAVLEWTQANVEAIRGTKGFEALRSLITTWLVERVLRCGSATEPMRSGRPTRVTAGVIVAWGGWSGLIREGLRCVLEEANLELGAVGGMWIEAVDRDREHFISSARAAIAEQRAGMEPAARLAHEKADLEALDDVSVSALSGVVRQMTLGVA